MSDALVFVQKLIKVSFLQLFQVWLYSWFCNHRPQGSNVTLKTSGFSDLTFCTLTLPRAKDQPENFIQPLTTFESKTKPKAHKPKASTWFMCDCVMRWRRCIRLKNLSQTPCDCWTNRGPAVSHVCLSVQMRPTCTEWSNSRTFCWVKAHI